MFLVVGLYLIPWASIPLVIVGYRYFGYESLPISLQVPGFHQGYPLFPVGWFESFLQACYQSWQTRSLEVPFLWIGFLDHSLSLCEFCSLLGVEFSLSLQGGFALLSSLQGLFSFCFIRSFPSQGSSGLGLFLHVLISFSRPCIWKLLVPLELGWALLAPSPLGMQINVGFICIFYNPLAVFSPFVPCQRFSILREFRGVTLSLSGTGLSLSWTFRELSLLCFRVSFLEEIGFIFSLP